MTWKSNGELGREYLEQADDLEREIERLRRKKPRISEEKLRLRRKINILETMMVETRELGNELIDYYHEE